MPRRYVVPATLLALAAATSQATAQGSATALPWLLDRADEIALARSAAPPAVSAAATVLVLERGGYVVADHGTTVLTCLVDRSDPRALEPHCYDREGSATNLRIRLHEDRPYRAAQRRSVGGVRVRTIDIRSIDDQC